MILQKLRIVLWKNGVIRKRHWLLTIFEIVIPVLLFAMLAAIRSEMKASDEEMKPAESFPVWTEDTITKGGSTILNSNSPILYAPDNDFSKMIMDKIAAQLKRPELLGFTNEEELLAYYNAVNDTEDDTYAIVFEDLPASGVPNNLKYKIRLSRPQIETKVLFPEFEMGGPGFSGPNYLSSSFLCFQLLLDKSFIALMGKNESTYKLSLQQFPYPPYHQDSFVQLFSVLLPFFTVVSFVMMCSSTLKRVVEEKQSGVKELMKMMGLKSWMSWLGWMLNAMIINIFSVTIITALLKIRFGEAGVLDHADCCIMWIFLMLYCIAGVTFCFAISSLFSRPTLAMSIGILLWFASYSVPIGYIMNDGYVPLFMKLLSALLPNTAMNFGFRIAVAYESKFIGITWKNLFQPPSGIAGDMSMGLVWLMLIFDVIVYSIITWYVSSIMPGKYGLARPLYFIFMPSYWRSSRVDDLNLSSDCELKPNKKFEQAPNNLNVGIQIRNLCKVFQSFGGYNKKVAVDGVSLDIYSGEITALLGHNGAGKTTTMSILTGMFSPTSGSVHINGYNIADNMDKVRESLGLCPQHNLLFTELTVSEHLIFFAMLKGCSRSEATREAKDLIQKLNLYDKRNQLIGSLSGGMKRKLSLGIALIGKTKVLMLDEPTSGMDPEARREIWDLLLNMRGERTILITTHFMEEADVLGDRIAIMDHGQVQCYGTSLFLKKLYGTGYQLNLLKEEGCEVSMVTSTIQDIVPDAKVKSEMGSVLCYMLPSEYSGHFPTLFDTLERNKSRLKIASIGVSITTLEEVFLRVGKEAEDESDGPSDTSAEYFKLTGSSEDLTLRKIEGVSLLIQQLRALCVKKIIFTTRKWITFTFKAGVAILMALLTVLLSKNSGISPEPALTLNLSDYGSTDVLYSVDGNVLIFSDSYAGLVKKAGSNVKIVENVSAEILEVGINNMQHYRNKFIVGAEFPSSILGVPELNGMFSSIAIHSAPISLNLLTNAVLKTKEKNKSITAINHPLQNKMRGESDVLLKKVSVVILWAILMPFGLVFLTGSFMTLPLIERVSKAKQLQLMTGVSSLAYWFTCFFWDLVFYLIVSSVMVLVITLADPLNIFNRSTEIGVYMLMLIMYGLSAIPFAYLISYFRNTNAGAFSILVLVNILIGLIMSVVVYVLLLSSSYETIGKVLKYILELIPHFTIIYGFMRFSSLVVSNNQCSLRKTYCTSFVATVDPCCNPDCKDGYCPSFYKPYLQFANKENPDAVGEEIMYMAADSVLYFILIMLVEYGVFGKIFDIITRQVYRMFPETVTEQPALDDDVTKEQDRVDGQVQGPTLQQTDDVLLVHNLEKKYTRNFTAVKGVSFGVAPCECFGLLGVNGAGKTTTFMMLTGDIIPTEGEAWIGQYNLKSHRSKYLAQIGYCPQFDALNGALTGREMLQLFANLRGVHTDSTEYEVNKWISLMGLREYENRQCGTYSGGNKRKLSTAMALVGDPQIICLDEPTSGVDPVARRNLWTVLASIQKSGQSVVLTSHSMEECEALCNRLVIMVNGHFMCMGGIQYLKQKYGQGFTVMVKLKPDVTDNRTLNSIKEEIEESFKQGCVLKDEHQGLLHYHVTNPKTPWSHLFKTMEKIKHDYEAVEDYTISETTLEQVFLSFAKTQNDVSAVNT